jgi:hypothetical protein
MGRTEPWATGVKGPELWRRNGRLAGLCGKVEDLDGGREGEG